MTSYRQRGKNKLWDYRIFYKKGKVIATNSGFKTKCEAMNEAQERERKMSQSKHSNNKWDGFLYSQDLNNFATAIQFIDLLLL